MSEEYRLGNFIFESEEELKKATEEFKLIKSICENYDTENPRMAARILELVKNGDIVLETEVGVGFLEKMQRFAKPAMADAGSKEKQSAAKHASKPHVSFADKMHALVDNVQEKIESVVDWFARVIDYIFNNKKHLIVATMIVTTVLCIAVAITGLCVYRNIQNKQAQLQAEKELAASLAEGVVTAFGMPYDSGSTVGAATPFTGLKPGKLYMNGYLNSFMIWTALQYVYTDETNIDGITIQEAIPIATYSLASEYMNAVKAGVSRPYWGDINEQSNTVFISNKMVEQRAYDLFGIRFYCDDFNSNLNYSGVFSGEDENMFVLLGDWGNKEPKFEIEKISGGIGKSFSVTVKYKVIDNQTGKFDEKHEMVVKYKFKKTDVSSYGFVMTDMDGTRNKS